MNQSLTIASRTEGRARVVALAGAMHVDSAARVREALLAAIDADTPCLILDLERLEFLGSAGLAAMVFVHNEAVRRGGDVLIARPMSVIESLLRIARLDRVFKIYPDLPAALRAVTGD